MRVRIRRREERRLTRRRTDPQPAVMHDAFEVARATDRFWRSDGSEGAPGSGLGLAIATDLLGALGGELTVATPEDGGLAVSLTLGDGALS